METSAPPGEASAGFTMRSAMRRHGRRPAKSGEQAKVVKQAADQQEFPPDEANSPSPRRDRAPPLGQEGLHAARAEQALLGVLTRDSPPTLDDPALKERLDRLSRDELDRLGRLVGLAQASKDGAERPLLKRTEDELTARGVSLDVSGDHNTVTVTVNTAPRSRDGDYTKSSGWNGQQKRDFNNRYQPRNSWGRKLGKVKGFLQGG